MWSGKDLSLAGTCCFSLASCSWYTTLPIAGVIITILDRSQITKRKQFDDIVDLIYTGYRCDSGGIITWPNLKQKT
jgi:hypothetical protein